MKMPAAAGLVLRAFDALFEALGVGTASRDLPAGRPR